MDEDAADEPTTGVRDLLVQVLAILDQEGQHLADIAQALEEMTDPAFCV